MEYKVSELFTSPQGEGVYTGVMMTFVRLAGCTVGKPFPREDYKPTTTDGEFTSPARFPIYTEQCTTWDGRKFACDTDYRIKRKLQPYQIVKEVARGVHRVCITGGEPLMHDLTELVDCIEKSGMIVHIETSGTKLINFPDSRVWVTVSPKFGCLPEMISRANEIKLLVDEEFNWQAVPKEIRSHEKVYIQPINFEFGVNNVNLKKCVALQKEHPKLRLSLQLHKVLSEYTKETVR